MVDLENKQECERNESKPERPLHKFSCLLYAKTREYAEGG